MENRHLTDDTDDEVFESEERFDSDEAGIKIFTTFDIESLKQIRTKYCQKKTVIISVGLAMTLAVVIIVTSLSVPYGQSVQSNRINESTPEPTVNHQTTSPDYQITSEPTVNLQTTEQKLDYESDYTSEVTVIQEISSDYCKTTGCEQAAATLLKAANLSVNPCEDFYEFACGGWNQQDNLPENESQWHLADTVVQNLKDRLINVLNATHREGSQLNATHKAQRYFQNCMNDDQFNVTAKIHTLRRLIEDILPQIFTVKYPTTIELFAGVARARTYGLTKGFFEDEIVSDYGNRSQNKIAFTPTISASELNLYRDQNETERNAYKRYLTYTLMHFMDGQMGDSEAMQLAQEIIEFEELLTEGKRDYSADKLITLDKFTELYISKLGISASYFIDYFRDAWSNSETNVTLSGSTIVRLYSEQYYKFFSEQLTSLNSLNATTADGKRRMFAFYVVWKIIKSYPPFSDNQFMWDPFWNSFQNHSSASTNSTVGTSADRLQFCFDTFLRKGAIIWKLPLSRDFLKVKEMVNYSVDAFKAMIEETRWISEKSRLAALKKLEKMTIFIGYNEDEDIVNDVDKLNREYEQLNSAESFLENLIFKKRWDTTRQWRTYQKVSLSPKTLEFEPTMVNAFNYRTMNGIFILPGIVQPPYFDDDYPYYWNFGALGNVIGHEITHSFDNKGILYGANGSLANDWDSWSSQNFTQRARKLMDQYRSYRLMGQQLNVLSTQQEDIADNGACRAAFYAYRKFTEMEKLPELLLPGLNYTPDQIFFIANAQIDCQIFRDSSVVKESIEINVHSPGRFRVIGPLQNFQEFSNTFNCPLGSYMNPVEKNDIW